ncbi:MAG: cyclodeaminase/cyclohydrolase family protein [Oscillospiraceae bacterium]|nr:cyclodeaminase/cyclohydrolase family protein [Oscillospiraceae bacterium]
MASLTEGTIRHYMQILASDAPAPGGGSAAALAGAIGASLMGMVGSLTEGRAKYAQHADFNARLLEQARAAQEKFLVLVDEDVSVFNTMSAAYIMPKATEAEKTSRTQALQEALKACTITPHKVLELCAQALELTEQAIGKTNRNVASDIGVAAACLKASAQGAWLNMLINLGSIKDESFVEEYRNKGAKTLESALRTADNIYETIKNKI